MMWGALAFVVVAGLVALVELAPFGGGATSGATWALVKNAAPLIPGTTTQVQWNSAFPNVLQRQKDQGKPVQLMMVSKGQPSETRAVVWGLVTMTDDPQAATRGVVRVSYTIAGAPGQVAWGPPEGTLVSVAVQDLYGVAG